MKCETCRYYKRRELTEEEKALAKYLPYSIVIKDCILGGCDGSRYEEAK